ncbi:Serine-threonine/tyrosine-protein kinase, catalytic domain [Dillenia turbinata]|uniref:Serine-threonine/tyrosine-protein kinase, catalytic domain n=1 Tax=Dillenia turbinata TaxID=194707 RepID=A0AAN8UTR0_9MAGN
MECSRTAAHPILAEAVEQLIVMKSTKVLFANRRDAFLITTTDQSFKPSMNHVQLQELLIFKLDMLATATNNFGEANKLGQGGFGDAYRGKVPKGQVIAVKRLSRASPPGIDEFINEVVVISKLQHSNSVKLLGCCVEGEGKMLVYEYMPNYSLDTFIFGHISISFLFFV